MHSRDIRFPFGYSRPCQLTPLLACVPSKTSAPLPTGGAVFERIELQCWIPSPSSYLCRMGIMLFSTVTLPLIGRTARHHGPASGLIRRAVGPPAACSSPAVRQDNDAQNDRYRNDRGEPVHYAPIMHSGTVTRPSDGSRYSLVSGSKSPGLLRTSMVNGRSVYRASCVLHHEGPEHRAEGGQAW